jgi:deoxyribodipyrimidine photolyase-related protein
MDGDRPLGGKWNYDAENRHRLGRQDLEQIPAPLLFENDVAPILERLERHGVDHFGQPVESLGWPVTRAQALDLLAHFCTVCLPCFGRFQDAMTGQHAHGWSLYHSRLSFALNSKLLSPMEVIDAAIRAYRDGGAGISIAQAEGFVRQIAGWREYVRAVYWANMPDYASANRLGAGRDLPGYFWDGRTRMNCMRHALGQSLDHAYAHHIQRLMITGNFCLLAGIAPEQVDAWYLGVYVDAIEWVEMPNTRGMSQFADGGYVATKPYSAGANYINKMSDYCRHCDYDHRQKSSPDACPFNSLYWDFMDRHRGRFEANPRIGMIYRNWDRQAEDRREATLARARWCLQHLDEL